MRVYAKTTNVATVKRNYDWGGELEKITDKAYQQHLYLIYAKISRNPLFKYITPEGHLQIFVSQYVKFKYPDVLCHHSPNEGKRGTFARWMLDLFIVKSVPDLMIYKPAFVDIKDGTQHCYGLAIELKIKGGKLSDRQRECLEQLRSEGWMTYTLFTFDCAKKVIDTYLR